MVESSRSARLYLLSPNPCSDSSISSQKPSNRGLTALVPPPPISKSNHRMGLDSSCIFLAKLPKLSFEWSESIFTELKLFGKKLFHHCLNALDYLAFPGHIVFRTWELIKSTEFEWFPSELFDVKRTVSHLTGIEFEGNVQCRGLNLCRLNLDQ
ncbi:nbs-lrr resistance protein [Corchorus olitorius]|uniref:Nbs-lrr resistance protein n=1 Tax=Corchorus olitorius TaxID=93759 RepID=A0A1R3FUP3_9ROSI|nr:nbs-lrr resistance protein [Corchorus olitorius]